MIDVKVATWRGYDEPFPTKEVAPEELEDLIAVVKDEIIKKGYVFSGAEHQNGERGMPVFSDGTSFRASMRAWGTIMADIYTSGDGEELGYMGFYMPLGSSAVMPEDDGVEISPSENEVGCLGLTTSEDVEIVLQSVEMGMPFMTTDKVLKEAYAAAKRNYESEE